MPKIKHSYILPWNHTRYGIIMPWGFMRMCKQYIEDLWPFCKWNHLIGFKATAYQCRDQFNPEDAKHNNCRLLCFLPVTFESHCCKQCGPSSDCSYRSSLIWVQTVCLYAKRMFEKFARRCSRRHKQMIFSDGFCFGILRVKVWKYNRYSIKKRT